MSWQINKTSSSVLGRKARIFNPICSWRPRKGLILYSYFEDRQGLLKAILESLTDLVPENVHVQAVINENCCLMVWELEENLVSPLIIQNVLMEDIWHEIFGTKVCVVPVTRGEGISYWSGTGLAQNYHK